MKNQRTVTRSLNRNHQLSRALIICAKVHTPTFPDQLQCLSGVFIINTFFKRMKVNPNITNSCVFQLLTDN